MDSEKWQVVESERGRGWFISESRDIRQVAYKLTVRRQVMYIRTPGGVVPVPGLTEGLGEFRASGAPPDLQNGDFIVLRREAKPDLDIQVVSSVSGPGGSLELRPASFHHFEVPT